MTEKDTHGMRLILCIFVVIGGIIISAGCLKQTGTPTETQAPGTQQTGALTENPFLGVWQFWGKIGDYKSTIMFTFLENKTGRYDLAVTDTTPPHFNSMEFRWELENDRLFIGSVSEQQHLDIRYHPDGDRMVVIADSESGIFVGDDFVPGPFTWEFSRVEV